MRNIEQEKTRLAFSYVKTRFKKQSEYFVYGMYAAMLITVVVMILTEVFFPNFILQDGLFSDWQRAFNSSKPFYSEAAGQYLDPRVVKGALFTEIIDSLIFSIFYFFGVLLTSFVLIFPVYNRFITEKVAGLTDDKILEGTEVLEDEKFVGMYDQLRREEQEGFTLTKVYKFEEVDRVPKAGKFMDLDEILRKKRAAEKKREEANNEEGEE
jgi:hypothetical protein